MSLKETYLAKIEAELGEVQFQLSALALRAEKAIEAGRAESHQLLLTGKTRHLEALHRLELVKSAGEESFETVKTAFETAWTDLKHALGPKG